MWSRDLWPIILVTIEGEWLSLSRCAMKAYLRLWVFNSYVLLQYILTACFGLLRAWRRRPEVATSFLSPSGGTMVFMGVSVLWYVSRKSRPASQPFSARSP